MTLLVLYNYFEVHSYFEKVYKFFAMAFLALTCLYFVLTTYHVLSAWYGESARVPGIFVSQIV